MRKVDAHPIGVGMRRKPPAGYLYSGARRAWRLGVSNKHISFGSSGGAILFELDERLCWNTEPAM
jgi:hypothetical protein